MAVTARLEARPLSGGIVLGSAALLGVAIVVLRMSGAMDSASAQTFSLVFTSIVVEALPFVLLGAFVAAAVEVFVPDSAFARLAGVPPALQLPIAALGGVAFPVCECGSIPVARRLITRGLHPGAGIAFMLAAPILNPVVLASTFVAYRGRGLAVEMVVGRAALGLLLAIAAGWALGTSRGEQVLKEVLVPRSAEPHRHMGSKARAFVDHLTGDFLYMGKFVVAGAALAAGLQTVFPQSLIAGLAATPLLGALSLMGLAFVLSLCSEADAFVAVSFTQFPLSSQLAFLVFGPAIDVKLAFMYRAIFRGAFVTKLILLAVPLVLAGTLWFEVLVR